LAIREKMAEQEKIKKLGLDVEEVENYADHLMKVADNSDMLADNLSELPGIAQEVSKATLRMNRGIETLADNMEDWQDILKNSDKSSQEYAEALSGISEAVADVANIDADWITDEFISDNLDLINKAATGSAEAIDELRSALAADIAVQISIQNGKD
jgi:methyl-accepting chemotaxis protein